MTHTLHVNTKSQHSLVCDIDNRVQREQDEEKEGEAEDVKVTVNIWKIVFTTVRPCVNGEVSMGLFFRSITHLWQQIFTLMPDKTAMSYYVFLWLLLSAFTERSLAINLVFL